MKKNLGFIAKRLAVALLVTISGTCLAAADNPEGLTFKVDGFTYRVIQDDKVELIEVPQKFKQLKQADCHIDLTPTIRYKKQYYELVSIPDDVFSDIHRDNRMVLLLPTTVSHIGTNNQIHNLRYNIDLYNNWMDTGETILLSKDGTSIVWVNKSKTRKFKQMPLPETIKVIPSWFWQCFPNMQRIVVPDGLDEEAIRQLFDDCTPYMKGRNLFLVQSDKTGEVIWKSTLCSHVTILDYPSAWDATHQNTIREHFTELELCLADGCEYPCIYMDGIPYNSLSGEAAIASASNSQERRKDTLTLSVNQFTMATPQFIAFHAPKHIRIVNNTREDVKFDRKSLSNVSQLAITQGINTSLTRIGKCYVDSISTPFRNYYGNLYNPTTGELFILTRQDTIEVWMDDENEEAMTYYIEQLTAANAVKHVVYTTDNSNKTGSKEKLADAGDAATSSKVYKVVERQPEFPGGMRELIKFLQKNIQYPTICQEQGIQGVVVVQFVVDENGNITDTQVVKRVNPYLDKEALRVISIMPPWNPGMQKGRYVRVRYTLPVTFKLKNK